MRFRCIHEFVIEAEDHVDFEKKMARYQALVDRASAKLQMGYESGIMHGTEIIQLGEWDG